MTIRFNARRATYFTSKDQRQYESKASSRDSLTIRIRVDDDHPPKLANTESCNVVPFLKIILAIKNSSLNDPIDTLVEQGHCRCGLNNGDQGTQQFASQPWLQRCQSRKLRKLAFPSQKRKARKAHELNNLNGHPIIAAVDEKLEEPWRKWEEIVGSPPS